MKKEFYPLVILCFLLPGFPGFTQIFCNDTIIIMDRKGKWTHGTDVIHDKEISATEKKEVFNRIDSLFDFLKEAYLQPVGCEPRWYRTVDSRKYNSPATGGTQPYCFSSLYLKYYCDKRFTELQLEKATNTWMRIFVNRISLLFAKSYLMEINGKTIQTYHMPMKAGEINGIPYYRLSTYSPVSKTILFTRKGETLFTPVNRRQYLEWYINDKKKRNKVTEENIRKTVIRSAEVQEAEKNKGLQKINEQFAKLPEKRKNTAIESFLNTWQTDEEIRDEKLKRFRETAARELKKYYDELNNSDAATLDKPACFGNSKNIFCEKEDSNNWTLVEINESYFKKNLPPYQPQIIIMHWDYNVKHIADRHLHNEIVNRFPFQKLQAMLEN